MNEEKMTILLLEEDVLKKLELQEKKYQGKIDYYEDALCDYFEHPISRIPHGVVGLTSGLIAAGASYTLTSDLFITGVSGLVAFTLPFIAAPLKNKFQLCRYEKRLNAVIENKCDVKTTAKVLKRSLTSIN